MDAYPSLWEEFDGNSSTQAAKRNAMLCGYAATLFIYSIK
jgi:hypothetical protein